MVPEKLKDTAKDRSLIVQICSVIPNIMVIYFPFSGTNFISYLQFFNALK